MDPEELSVWASNDEIQSRLSTKIEYRMIYPGVFRKKYATTVPYFIKGRFYLKLGRLDGRNYDHFMMHKLITGVHVESEFGLIIK
jgi:hypothetical protein